MNQDCTYDIVAKNDLAALNNEKYFSDLYTHYWYKVFRHSYEYTGLKQEAEDMAQEVFLKLWQHFDRISGQLKNAEGYLFIMARNSCHNHYKKEQRKQLRYKRYCKANEEAWLHDEIVVKEINRIAIKAVQQLPEKQKKVFIYRDMGLGRKEIATILNVSVNTVDANINIAMKKVQQYVSRELNLPTAA
jgi:RNA polymerase sigma-70 factor (ECF subfamily)